MAVDGTPGTVRSTLVCEPIPVSAGPALATAEPAGPRILLVEDAPRLRQSLADYLAGAGYRVIHACHGLDGWCAFELERPDLVVLDLDMPLLSGFRLLRLLRTTAGGPCAERHAGDHWRVPVIVASRYDVQQARDTESTSRREVYLRKPITAEALVGCVTQVFRSDNQRVVRRESAGGATRGEAWRNHGS